MVVQLKVDCTLDFPVIGRKLAPHAAPDSFGHDSENVYEWMYVNVPGISFSLNVSREHGWADIEDELESTLSQEALEALVKRGPVHIFGWDRTANASVDSLPDWLPQYIADRLLAKVYVYDRRVYVDDPEPDPISVVIPLTEEHS